MKKNTLLSILAISSTSVAAYADAVLDVIKTDATTDWSNASEGIDLADGIFTSTVPMSQTIGMLVKGQYILNAATNNNAKFTINGKDYELGSILDIAEEMQVTIGISAGTNGSRFEVGNFELTLVYKFRDAKNALGQKLSSAIGKLVYVWGTEGFDEKGKALSVEASGIGAEIEALKDKQKNSYDLYKKNKLYLGVDNAELPLNKQIADLNTRVEANVANTKAYNYVAEHYVDAVNQKLVILKAGIENAGEADKEYVEGKFLPKYQEYVDDLKAYEDALKSAFANDRAVEAYPTETVDKAAEEFLDKINADIASVGNAAKNNGAYQEVQVGILEMNTLYLKITQELTQIMPVDGNYKDLLSQAVAELAALNARIQRLSKKNDNERENDVSSDEEIHKGNIAELNSIKEGLNGVNTKYTNWVEKNNANYTTATAFVEALETKYNGIDNVDVKAKFEKELGDFAKRISDLKGAVEAAYADYTIEKDDIFSGLQTTANDITNDIDKFVNGQAKSVLNNYNNYQATMKMVDGLQKTFDEAKKAVGELKVEKDESYSAAAKFEATAKELQDVLDSYRVEAKKVYDANYKDGKVDLYEPEPIYKDTEDGIADYKSVATNVVEHLNGVLAAVADGKTALEALKKAAADTDVTVLSGDGQGTYGSNISDLTKYYEEIEKKVAEANELLDAEHAEAVSKITVDDTKKSLAKTLTDNYSDAKAEYDKNINIIAGKKMLQQAQNNYNDCNEAYRALVEKTALQLGRSQGVFDSKLSADVVAPLNYLQNQINNIGEIDENNALQAIALLKEVNGTIAKIRTAILALDNEANKILESLKEIADAKAAVDKDLVGVEEQLNGNPEKKLDGVAALNKDNSKEADFSAKIEAAQAEIDGLENEMQESVAAETFLTDQEDKLNEAGEVEKKGFNTRVKELGENVQKLRAEAEQATKNFNSKEALEKFYGAGEGNLDIQVKITAATEVVNGDKVTGAGETYFLNLISGYQKAFDDIKAEITKGYNEGKLNESEIAITNKLKDLEKNVSAVPDNAVNNDKAYKTLKDNAEDGKESVQNAWNAAYIEISANYNLIDLDQILNKLTAEQTKLTAAKKAIDDAFAKGTCHNEQTDLQAELDKISDEIANILNSTKDGYDAAIAKDNQTRYAAFLKAIDETNSERVNAINTINKYYSIQNIAYEKLIEPIRENHKAIFEYAEKIADLKQTALDEKTAATGNHADGDKAFYDVMEDNKGQAESYTEEIKDILESFRGAVEGLAEGLYNKGIKEANDELAAAEKVLNDAKYNSNVVSKAFGDVRTIISDAEAARKGVDFPLALDKILTNFATIGEKLEAGYEPAAVSEWQYCLDEIDVMIAGEQTEMAKFEYLPSNTVDYDKRYAEEVVENRKAATKIVAEAESLFGENLAVAKAELSKIKTEIVSVDGKDVKHTVVYNEAASASKNNADNLAAIDKINGFLDIAQGCLDDAKAFIDAMIIRNGGIAVEVKAIQTSIDNARKEVANFAKNGGAVGKEDNYKNSVELIKGQTEGLYGLAINADPKKNGFYGEKAELERQIELLKKDYNNATTIEGVTLEELKQLKDRMDALPEALKKVSEFVDGKDKPIEDQQKECIALESEIADIQNSLVNIYDSNKPNITLNDLNKALDAVKEDADEQSEVLAACHETVKNAYSDQLAAIQAELEAISADIAEKAENKTILLYADNISKDIAAAQENLEALGEKIANDQKPYTINQEAYDRLSNEIEALRTEKETLASTIENYKYFNLYEPSNTSEKEEKEGFAKSLEEVDELFAAAEKDLNERYNSDELLTENDKLLDIDKIVSELATITKAAAHFEYHSAYNVLISDLREANGLREKDGRCYTKESDEAIRALYNSIDNMFLPMAIFNHGVYNKGGASTDINGNPYTDKEDNQIYVELDYMTEAVPLLAAKVSELESLIAEFENKVESEYYIPGDITKDNNVYVDDYMGIIDLVLNPTELEDLDFLRADITEDGEINIGDITKVSKVISGVGTDSKQAKAYRTKSQQSSEDAVTVSVSSTGANTYRLALSLDNSVAYAGAQMDIVLPVGATLLNESLASRASSHKLYSSDIDGIHRIVISSADVATFADGDKALVYLDVAVSGNAKAEEVVVTNIVMADANAYTYKMKSVNGNFDGTVGIEDDVTVDNEGGVRQKIYDVSGALIKKLQKGINIIRNSDGTVKKVFKK